MSDGRIAITNPRLLLEAARVFNAPGSGHRDAAASVAEQALAALKVQRKTAPGDIEPEVEQAIIGDCAALRLAGRVDGGYSEALALLDEQIGKKRPDGLADELRNDVNGRLHLLRAFARGQQYNDLRDKQGKPPDDPECVNLRQAIRDDLKTAFALNPNLQNINRPAWDPGPGQEAEADLAKAYREGPEIKEAVSAAHPAAAAEQLPSAAERSAAAAQPAARGERSATAAEQSAAAAAQRGATAEQPATAPAQYAAAAAQAALAAAQAATAAIGERSAATAAQPAATAQRAAAVQRATAAGEPPRGLARDESLDRAGNTPSSEPLGRGEGINRLFDNFLSEQAPAADPGAATARDMPVGPVTSGAPRLSGAYFPRSQILEWLGDLHHWPVGDDQRRAIEQHLRSLLDVLAAEERSGITTLGG
jgi:hypothetical protein